MLILLYFSLKICSVSGFIIINMQALFYNKHWYGYVCGLALTNFLASSNALLFLAIMLKGAETRCMSNCLIHGPELLKEVAYFW